MGGISIWQLLIIAVIVVLYYLAPRNSAPSVPDLWRIDSRLQKRWVMMSLKQDKPARR